MSMPPPATGPVNRSSRAASFHDPNYRRKSAALNREQVRLLNELKKTGNLWHANERAGLFGLGRWSKRWTVLTHSMLLGFERPQDDEPVSAINLLDVREVIPMPAGNELKRPFAFMLDLGADRATLAAESSEELHDWVTSIRAVKINLTMMQVLEEEQEEAFANGSVVRRSSLRVDAAAPPAFMAFFDSGRASAAGKGGRSRSSSSSRRDAMNVALSVFRDFSVAELEQFCLFLDGRRDAELEAVHEKFLRQSAGLRAELVKRGESADLVIRSADPPEAVPVPAPAAVPEAAAAAAPVAEPEAGQETDSKSHGSRGKHRHHHHHHNSRNKGRVKSSNKSGSKSGEKRRSRSNKSSKKKKNDGAANVLRQLTQ